MNGATPEPSVVVDGGTVTFLINDCVIGRKEFGSSHVANKTAEEWLEREQAILRHPAGKGR